MKKDRERLKAVSDDKLIDFLKNIGLYEQIINQTVKCKFCNEILTLERISAIFPDSGSIKLSCDKPSCLAKMNNHLKQKI